MGYNMGHEASNRLVHTLSEAAVENTPLGIIEWNKDLNIIRWSGNSEGIFGWKSGEVIGKSPFKLNLLHHEDADILIEKFGVLLKKEISSDVSTLRCFNHSMKVLHIEWYSTAVENTNGEVESVVSFAHDITPLVNVREQLRKSNEDLEQFGYVVSHDLQEPLRMITGFLQILQKKYGRVLDEAANKYIDFAVDGAERMKNMIHDLLALSRTGRNMEVEDVDLYTLLNEVKMIIDADIQENDAKITYDELPVISADRQMMQQLFLHLIANAIRFRRKDVKPVIHISFENKGHEWLCKVNDNGIGILPKDWERVFVVFQKLHGRNEYPGSGIGLAISKKIVEMHGGKIWLESEPGKGSTFYFSLPKG